MGKLGFVGLICSGVSLGSIILSTAIPYWIRREGLYYDRPVVRFSGLWMGCMRYKDRKEATCYESKDVLEYELAVRAFVLMGLFLVAFAAILKIIHLFVRKENQNISVLAGVIAIGAGICMLIAVGVFAGRRNLILETNASDYHVGFALAVIGGIVAVVSGVMFIVGKSD